MEDKIYQVYFVLERGYKWIATVFLAGTKVAEGTGSTPGRAASEVFDKLSGDEQIDDFDEGD